MSARPRAGSLGLMKARGLYETCYGFLLFGVVWCPVFPFSSDALGMPWESMGCLQKTWEIVGVLLVHTRQTTNRRASECEIFAQIATDPPDITISGSNAA